MKLHIFAPNVHMGGGLILLQSILSDIDKNIDIICYLDARARNKLIINSNFQVKWTEATLPARIFADYSVNSDLKPDSIILCFHGLPPLFSRKAKTIIFIQNRILITKMSLQGFSLRSKIRILIERFFIKYLRNDNFKYIVQTTTMEQSLRNYLSAENGNEKVIVLPFIENDFEDKKRSGKIIRWDFIYVADGEAHKNHLTLINAWKLLSDEGIYPTLALTLPQKWNSLLTRIEYLKNKADIKIENLGSLTRDEIFDLYSTSKALIYPSLSESFGLPLIEATQFELPILASELDYVRDICEPKQTFDPHSPLSIARAVKRHLGICNNPTKLFSPRDFINEVLK